MCYRSMTDVGVHGRLDDVLNRRRPTCRLCRWVEFVILFTHDVDDHAEAYIYYVMNRSNTLLVMIAK